MRQPPRRVSHAALTSAATAVSPPAPAEAQGARPPAGPRCPAPREQRRARPHRGAGATGAAVSPRSSATTAGPRGTSVFRLAAPPPPPGQSVAPRPHERHCRDAGKDSSGALLSPVRAAGARRPGRTPRVGARRWPDGTGGAGQSTREWRPAPAAETSENVVANGACSGPARADRGGGARGFRPVGRKPPVRGTAGRRPEWRRPCAGGGPGTPTVSCPAGGSALRLGGDGAFSAADACPRGQTGPGLAGRAGTPCEPPAVGAADWRRHRPGRRAHGLDGSRGTAGRRR